MNAPVVVYHPRKQAAKHIKDKYGQPVTNSLLAKLAVYGGGPPFRKTGGEAIYEELDLDLWAESRIGPKIHSTAELTVGRTKSKGRPPRSQVDAAKAKAEAAANLARKEAEAKRLAAVERRKPKVKSERRSDAV